MAVCLRLLYAVPMDFDSKLASAPHCIFLSVFRTHCASCLVDLVISLELEASFHRRGFVRLIARNKKQTVGPSAAGVSRRVLCPDLCFPRAAAPESMGSLGSEAQRHGEDRPLPSAPHLQKIAAEIGALRRLPGLRLLATKCSTPRQAGTGYWVNSPKVCILSP